MSLEEPSSVEALQGQIALLERELQEVRSSLASMVDERTQQLEQAKREWEQTFDAINDPVVIIDHDYRIVRANLATATVVKQDIRSLIQKPCYETLMGRQESCEDCPLAATLEEGEGRKAKIPHDDGETLYELRSFPLSGNSTVVHEYRDITEERRIQAMLVQADKLSSIGLLAGRVAHEINNPLAAILAQTQLLFLDVEPDGEVHRSLKDIETAALRCRKIVQDLLEFSRQKPTDRRGRHSFRKLVQQTLELFALMPPKESATLEVELPEDLPDIHVDPDQMKSVLLNLLSNAKAATPATGAIQVKAGHGDGEVWLMIKDTGDGIPSNLQEKIFMPFFTTKAAGLGTGLGLHIVNELVKQHEGRIELQSEPGQGTEFRIVLPLS